jgi:alpha-tubulin suppressor-like RCC1 family protein
MTSKKTHAAKDDKRRYSSMAVAFGRNFYYALGSQALSLGVDDDTTGEAQPPRVWNEPPWLNGTANYTNDPTSTSSIVQAVATCQSTAFLTSTGRVYAVGTLHGRVYPNPYRVEIPLPLTCVQLAAGRHFLLARMEGGRAVVSWGAGHFGQLGVGSDPSSSGELSSAANNESSSLLSITFTPHPILIERLLPQHTGSPVASIAAGDWHGLALTESGRVWAWGSNRNMQCGRQQPTSATTNTNNAVAPTLPWPLPVPLPVAVTHIAAGRAHSLAVSARGQVYAWGCSHHGQCGTTVRRAGIAPPRLVETLGDVKVVSVAAAGNHTVALTAGGRVLAWGAGSEGQLGLGPAVSAQTKPRLVAELDFVAIAAGVEWKSQQQQQQRVRVADEGVSEAASALASIPRIRSVFAGSSYSAAISTSGHVYVWGSNDAGQMGVPTPAVVPMVDGNATTGDDSQSSSIRNLHVKTFDSRHNILLPVRIDAIAETMNVRTLAAGPNHFWCIGENRLPTDELPIVGRTLYEVQEGRRVEKLQRARESLRALVERHNSSIEDNADDEDWTESSLEATGVPSTPETVVQTLGDSDAVSSQIQSLDLDSPHPSAIAQITTESPKNEKRPNLIRRFSLRKAITRLSSNRSDKDDADPRPDTGNNRRARTSRRVVSRKISM